MAVVVVLAGVLYWVLGVLGRVFMLSEKKAVTVVICRDMSRAGRCKIKSNQIKSNQSKSNQIKSGRNKRQASGPQDQRNGKTKHHHHDHHHQKASAHQDG
jgi:hypothetical protein